MDPRLLRKGEEMVAHSAWVRVWNRLGRGPWEGKSPVKN